MDIPFRFDVLCKLTLKKFTEMNIPLAEDEDFDVEDLPPIEKALFYIDHHPSGDKKLINFILKDADIIEDFESFGIGGLKDLIDFVATRLVDLWANGYDNLQKCLVIYRDYDEVRHFTNLLEFEIPNIRRLAHPTLKAVKYPGIDDETTPQFRTYLFDQLRRTKGASHILTTFRTLGGVPENLDKFITYAKMYNLWHLSLPELTQVYTNALVDEMSFAHENPKFKMCKGYFTFIVAT